MAGIPSLIPATLHEKVWGRRREGMKLGEIWCRAEPLLLKFIFTTEKLSVQVHPGDDYARLRENSAGKTECWYITAVEPGARLAAGFRHPMTREQVEESIQAGTIEQELNWIEVHPGDFIFMPWGTVHAIGAGLTLCEIQEFSDITYRLFDYGRPRELHVEKGLDVIRQHPAAGRIEPVRLGDNHDFFLACRYFAVERLTCSGEYRSSVDPARFEVLILLQGEGEIISEDGRQPYRSEQMWRLPAGVNYRLIPRTKTTLLKTYAPPSLAAILTSLAQSGVSESELNRVIISNL